MPCEPIDSSPPGSTVPGILQARTLEWVAISFSNAWKWKVKVKSLTCVRLLATPWTAAYQGPPSMATFPYFFLSPFFFIPPQLLTLTNWANAGLSKNSTWQLSVWDCANAHEQEAWILGQPPTVPIISLATVRDENLWAKTQGYISLSFPHPIKVQSSCSNE